MHDDSPRRLLSHLVPRNGAEAAFEVRVRAEVAALRERAAGSPVEVTAMFRAARDPFGANTLFRAAIELRGSASDLSRALQGLGERLADVAHPDLCSALVGVDHVFIASQRAPVRYQYLMRRNAAFTHDAYLTRYRELHAQFGLRTPGILGYVQLHVDPALSAEAACAAGFGIHAVDSVSELHLASLDEFLRAVASSPIGAEAVADEEIFVDRRASFDFVSSVEWLPR